MFWLLSAAAETSSSSAATESHAEGAAHHTPLLVQRINDLVGPWLHKQQMEYTYPVWEKFLGYFGTTPEAAFGEYTPENAVPWYTVMFIIACILSVALIWILKGRLTQDEPDGGQQTLEVSVLALRNMLEDIVGPHGLKYFPVVATFAVLILVSNIMGFFPLFKTPTAATSVTFALGLSSFLYYNYIGVKENGLFGHLRHFAGPIWWISPLIFLIEIIGNLVRPLSLGLRLFGNMFADEAVNENIAKIAEPYTFFVLPLLMPLGLFVALIQTFVFTLLSMVYISEVSHPPHEAHEEHEHSEHAEHAEDNVMVPA